jgi:hypothetical protein
MRARLWAVLGASALVGCASILGAPDLTYDPNATAGGDAAAGGDGALGGDGASGGDGAAGDAGTCNADLQTDPKNCGRCGHDCVGGQCNAGTCGAFQLANIPNAPLRTVVADDTYAFVSTRITLTTQAGGIWRVPKSGGAAEPYVTLRYATGMAIVADKLYFAVNDAPENGTVHGGLWSCPRVGAAPCTPTLVAAADSPYAVTTDGTRVFYTDSTAGKGLMVDVPPAAPTVFRLDYNAGNSLFVDGVDAFYTTTIYSSPQIGKLIQILPDAGYTEVSVYQSNTAEGAEVSGTAASLLFTAYDYQTTAGGVVRRVPRTGAGTPCDYAAGKNKRPHGLYQDATRVYWTNMGEGDPEAATGGSVASCPLAGCCTTADVLWSGDGQPDGVTGDATALYFVTYAAGSVWKVAKP